MNEDLKKSFQQIVADFGPEIINDKNLANIVADYYSFDRNPAVRNILKTVVSEGYAVKVSQLKSSKGNPCVDLERYAGEIEQSWGYGKEQVRFVLSCIASSVGIEYKIDNSNKRKRQPISSPPNTPIVNQPINPNQNNQQSPRVHKNKAKYLLWSVLIVFVLIGIIIWQKSSSPEDGRLALDHAKECYDNGDYNKAFEIWEEYAKLDSVRGMNGLGRYYYVKQNYKEAMKWFRKAAEQGYANAQCNIGNMYYNGKGVPVDYEEARKWYAQAAEQGYAPAQCNMGNMYYNGKGVPVDYETAFKWYTKAAEQGDAEGQCYLGYQYEFGQGVKQDYSEAVKWYRKAAELGNADGQCNLAIMYWNGKGIAQDNKEAFKWCKKAAEQGLSMAETILGDMYYNGDGVEKNNMEAVRWYQKAADKGFADAQCNLGAMYHFGYGVEQSYAEAMKWYLKAAEQGLSRAEYQLGSMYFLGQGTEKNLDEAFVWITKAYEHGDPGAKELLEAIKSYKK